MTMLTRRDWITLTMGASAALALDARKLFAQQALITRAIPSTGERLPVVGLGSSATFSQVARTEDVTALRDVLKTLVEHGGTIFDTAPGYGASEEVAGRLVNELGIVNKVFWATKLNAARGATASPADARAQLNTSFARVKKDPVDLIQVHNLGDVPTQLAILKEQKAAKKIRYIGVTTTFDQQYDQIIRIMRTEPLDFIGVDYAVDGREVEQQILPLAQERKIAVLAYAPFGRTRLFRRVGDRPVPDWAKEFDAATWAQFFLKWVVSHPAITAATPATSQPKNMIDNMGGAMGRLPDQAMRKRMADFIDALPQA
jgi:aryl-alcohol dehydrogenase-like predicted oxidoreductase